MISLAARLIDIYRTDGLLVLFGKSVRFCLLRVPLGYESLCAIEHWLHRTGTETEPNSRQGGAPPAPPDGDPPVAAGSCERLYPSGGPRWGDSTTTFPTIHPIAENPVLTRRDVSDYGHCEFVADPFMFVAPEGEWHLFFEAYNSRRPTGGVIAHATSENGRSWAYDRVVLKSDQHLSFPYVFRWDGGHYMIPETGAADGRRIRLYRADEFPYGWTEQNVLLTVDHRTDDAVVFRHDDRWWMLIGASETNSTYLYYAESLTGTWRSHPQNPVVHERPTGFRPGGRPVVTDSHLTVFFQDCQSQYGDKLRAFEIAELTVSDYNDRECQQSPVLEGTGGTGWNSGRMHHIDPWYVDGQWRCAVDGGIGIGASLLGDGFSIGMYGTQSADQS